MIHQSLLDLWYGFGIALQPHNLIWSFVGVLIGNMVGVLPGMGAPAAMSILLPLTFTMNEVPATMMLAGIFYGAMYGGALGAILLNLPTHAPHAVTCLDGYPLARQGRGGAALGITMIASFFAASFGIMIMVLFSPLLVKAALQFGAADMFSIMLLGLLAGSTMSGGSPLKSVAMTLLGILAGVIGTDAETGMTRFSFGLPQLWDGVGLVPIVLGLFGVADFLFHVNRRTFPTNGAKVKLRDMRPTKAELKQSFFPLLRGTLVGALFGAMPGTGPTITTFVAYTLERKISKTPERFGLGALEGVASPEASSHSKLQIDFIPTMCLGIPGDVVMALILGALMIHGIAPGPQLITQHRDLFWGLVASFWVGNILLVLFNVPLIGLWVKLLQVPYRYLVPTALFFIAIGAFTTENSLFQVLEVLFFGAAGALLLQLRFPLAPILLGFVLGPMVEGNFRRAVALSHGSLAVFVHRPISAVFLTASAFLICFQIYAWLRKAIPRQAGKEKARVAP